MKKILILSLLLWTINIYAQNNFYTINNIRFELNEEGASRLAALPLKCLHQEYPNKTSHTSMSDSDHIMTPRQLHPVFYGCFDWHSCVHGHWMLVRLLKDFPQLPEATAIRAAINRNINPENMAQEIAYFRIPLSRSWERTYGWAWLLKLQQELTTWNDEDGIHWRIALQPLCDTIISRWMDFLPKQTYANRTGVHNNTAFGLILALDYARIAGDKAFEAAIIKSSMELYAKDKNVPAEWEPNGTDFLSPALIEADLMRRVLNKLEFIKWFNDFLSGKSLEHFAELPVVSDRNDYQIVHLDGLCFSRSWCMRGIASVLPDNDKRKLVLIESAVQHLNMGLSNITEVGYGGEHWLASFAIYALNE
ncbi:MAG: DUF2891 domain-containing protein [Prevotellaceae bacterium]|jgi:hypothetical protein|nr:DUF2891 domain-containing protein [Prevotellaceae bacterium]